tara:strand:- start:2 stop:142 length:141 start_codon:yes stop_codon:yes gene_type:complete
MGETNEINEAFLRIDYYIMKNNYDIIAPVIDSIILNDLESDGYLII